MKKLNTRQKTTLKQVGTITAFILVFVMLIGLCLQLFGTGNVKPSEWFKPDTPVEQPDNDLDQGVAVVPDTNGNGVKLAMMRIAAEDYDDYGIEPYADSAFTITATVTDSDGNTPADIQKVTYSIAWATTDNKTLSNYVTMNVSGTTATFTCKAAFSTQIIVTCASDIDSTKKATATLDYYKRVSGFSSTIGDQSSITNGTIANVSGLSSYSAWNGKTLSLVPANYTYGTGTKIPAISNVSYRIEFSTAFKTQLKNEYSDAAFTFKTVSASGASVSLANKNMANLVNEMITSTSKGDLDDWFFFFNNALAATTNQMTVSITLTTAYGNANINYTLNFSATGTTIGNVTIDNSSFIF